MVMAVQGALGRTMVELCMVRLNTPAFFPFFFGLRLDPLWFALRNVTIAEISVILPPMDQNLFAMNSVLPLVWIRNTFKGVWLFFVSDIKRLGILIASPAISLWLPGLMNR
jgi:C4-dicarboxylate transporter DctM subunit